MFFFSLLLSVCSRVCCCSFAWLLLNCCSKLLFPCVAPCLLFPCMTTPPHCYSTSSVLTRLLFHILVAPLRLLWFYFLIKYLWPPLAVATPHLLFPSWVFPACLLLLFVQVFPRVLFLLFFVFFQVVFGATTNKQKPTNKVSVFRIFLTFHLIIFKSFPLVFQFFVQHCNTIFFFFDFTTKRKKRRNCLKLVNFFNK